jgi:Fe-S cluster assembly scaffold protein SufB
MNEPLTSVDTALLETIADMPGGKAPGAVNIRKDSGCAERVTTENIDIRTKTDKPGIDIIVKPGTKGESCHIPVIITKSGLTETVYNDFFIGEDAEVTIIAGCGIHNCGESESRHDGVHAFHIGKTARVTYVEKHYGDGDGSGKRVMNPQTIAYLDEGAFLKMDTSQIKGIDSTKRDTRIVCGKGAETLVTERLQTHGDQIAESDMEIVLDGDDARGRVSSRSVAQERSQQVFCPRMTGNARCFGHVQCDSIIMDDARISSTPAIVANSTEAQLIHEAAIGKIAGEQLLKLETLGLTREEAEERILRGFLA